MYNGIETNSSYVTFVENGILTSIVDNLLAKAGNKALNIGASDIINQKTKYYYDCENETLKSVILTEYFFDNTTAIGVSEYVQVVF